MTSFVARLGLLGLLTVAASPALAQGAAPTPTTPAPTATAPAPAQPVVSSGTAAAVTSANPAATAGKMPAPENKWRIECSEGAKSNGEIVFRVTPKGGTSTDVRVAVKQGTSENNVADTIRDAFKAQLPKSHYAVEVDDGEDVLVKKRSGKPNFSLQLVSNSVKAVRIHVDRE
jgi:hypothetical protein